MTRDFEEVWEKVQQHAGETFYLLGGMTFTYEIIEDKLQSCAGERPISAAISSASTRWEKSPPSGR